MALASSVTPAKPPSARTARAAYRSPRRNICGVWASHLSSRATVACTRPPRSAFRVSGKGRAKRPPTASGKQASIRASTCAGVIRQRAASCTSTQSASRTPRARKACKPWNTLCARVLPPQSARSKWAGQGAPWGHTKSSPGESTTKPPTTRGTAPKAARVCKTRACPAMGWYCLGWAVPARLPAPAQGTRTKQRGGAAGSKGAKWRRGASGTAVMVFGPF